MGKKVLKASVESDDEENKIEKVISEFCFMAIEQVEDKDNDELQQAFEDLHKDSIMLAKKKQGGKKLDGRNGQGNQRLNRQSG